MKRLAEIGALTVVASALAACSTNGGVTPPTAVTNTAAPQNAGAHARERVLYSFAAGSDGGDPFGTLIFGPGGALYGTTGFGGGGACPGGCGTVFKLTRSKGRYTETVLYRFRGYKYGDGYSPDAGLVADASGALYGTTEYGGNPASFGTVFKLTPSGSTYSESILYIFKGGQDGYAPLGGLTMDAKGNLYGSTLLGGGAAACPSSGCGTVFELQPSGSQYNERVIYRFQSGSDGATPGSAPIFVGKTLYGTAATGGGNPSCGGAPINRGCGTVYKLTPAHRAFKFSVVYAFSGTPSDAANPFAQLTAGKNGSFYGTGQYGGSANAGSAFMLAPAGSGYRETLIHSFISGNDGSYPVASVTRNANGALFGVTQYGGSSANAGIAYELRPSGSSYAERVLYRFSTLSGGEYPVGGLLLGSKRILYGTTTLGGSASAIAGTVFSLNY